MKYRYIHISAALFLIAGMAMQFVLSYQQALRNVQENIDLKTQVAHEKILFELYDAYEVIDLMKQYVEENLMEQLMEEFKPFDDAVCVIYSTDGKLLTSSENLAGRRYNAHDYLHTSHF